MSGIVAIFFRDGQPAPVAAARKAIATLSAGVRSWDTWNADSIVLSVSGTCPRTAQDLSVLKSEQGRLAMVAVARLDNIPELARQLGLSPDRYATDAEWVLAAYEKWQSGCPEHLLGDFVFAIWDSTRQELVCARDQLGCRSLVIHRTDQTCALASSVSALLATGMVPRAVNPQRIVDCLVEPLEGADFTSTCYLHIQRVPPAHVLQVTNVACQESKYWSLSNAAEVTERSEADWLDGIHDHLRRAVARRLVGNVGSMLSGGMDSSSIVALAREIRLNDGGDPVPILSFAFDDDPRSADSRYSRELAAMPGLCGERLGEHDIADDALTELFCETPTCPFDMFMQLAALVYGRAQKCGLSAVLDGIDGDLVFGIHAPYLPLLVRRGRIVTFGREILASHRLRSDSLPTLARSVAANVLNALPGPLHLWRKPIVAKNAAELCAHSIVRTEFARQQGVVERMAALRAFSPPTDDYRQRHIAWAEHPFSTVGMERYERIASHFGVRPRHPMFDVQLLEYCVNLPWNLRTKEGWSKYGLRKAMTRSLSAETCWRQEYDNLYPRVVGCFLKHHRGRLRHFVERELEHQSEFLDVPRIQQDMRDFSDGNRGAGFKVWHAYYLAKWLESA